MPVLTPTPLPQPGTGLALTAASPTPLASLRATATSIPNPTTTASAAAATYTDGTYTGTGSSRRGDVWVSVEVVGGRIANVSITRSTLQYPLRDIAGLPAEVVERQSAQVDIVSRATYSSQAFRTAVSQALVKATS
jgi:uncharacterized protein with FMN-binding domain